MGQYDRGDIVTAGLIGAVLGVLVLLAMAGLGSLMSNLRYTSKGYVQKAVPDTYKMIWVKDPND